MFCGKCGSEIQDGLRFCPNCGSSTDGQQMQQPAPQVQQPVQQVQYVQQPPEKKGKGKMVLIVVIALVVIVGVVGAFGSGGSKGTSVSNTTGSSTSSAPAKQDTSSMPIGTTATLDNGMEVTVNEIEAFTPQYMTTPLTRVHVTYVNNSDKKQSFNIFDWKAEDAGGAERTITAWSGDNDLGSGDLKAGGTVSGNVYFEGHDIAKVYYYSNVLFQDESDICWIVS